MSEFRAKQNWTEKMAGQDRREGFVMDEAIFLKCLKGIY